MTDSVYQMIARAQAEYAQVHRRRPARGMAGSFSRRLHLQDHHRRQSPRGAGRRDHLREFARACCSDRVSALREANIYERQSYRHILGQPSILSEESGDEVRSETSFLVARIVQDGDTDIFATGRYLDRYKIEGGKAQLNERIVVCDSSRIDTLMALPL